jgi:protein TonB
MAPSSTPDIPPPAPETATPPAPSQPEMPPPAPPQPEIPKPTPPSPEIPPPTPEPTRQPPPQTPPTPKPPQPMAEMPRHAALEPPPPPKPRHIPRNKAAPHREPPRPIVEATPPPSVKPTPSSTPAARPTQTAAAPGTGAGPGTKAGPGKGAEGIGKGAIGTAIGPGDDYLERLYRHLLQYKTYPPEAISQKRQGAVVIGFTIARDGRVSDARIEKSSGSPILDRATLALVQRASPVPSLPDTFKGGAARVKFPINYELGLIDELF